MFYVLAGVLPFDASNYGPQELSKEIIVDQEPNYDLLRKSHYHCSDEAVDLIQRLLQPVNNRISMKTAMTHQWLNMDLLGPQSEAAR